VSTTAHPIRTCVGCRARDARETLTRVVVRDGRIVIDVTKRAAGRGAWLHARATCVDAFARKGGFVRALRCVIPKPERAALRVLCPEEQG